MNKNIKTVGLMFLFALSFLAAYDLIKYKSGAVDESEARNTEAKSNQPKPKNVEQPLCDLSAKERLILRSALIDEYTAWIDGRSHSNKLKWDSFKKPISTSSDQIQYDYEQNEVSADRKYRHRTMKVKGVALSINRGVGDSYYLELSGGTNMFMHPKAFVRKEFEDYLAKVQKYQSVDLICTDAELLMGSATLHDCRPYDYWAMDQLGAHGNNLIYSANHNDSHAEFIMVILALGELLPENSACLHISREDCNAEISSIAKDKQIFMSAIERAAQRIKRPNLLKQYRSNLEVIETPISNTPAF